MRVARNRGPGVTVEQVATDFGVHPMTLWKWMRRADIDLSSFRVWCGSGWCWGGAVPGGVDAGAVILFGGGRPVGAGAPRAAVVSAGRAEIRR
ncbi:hypothetical protein C1C94_0031965 [Streptomyces sp. SMS_SU21]|nr:hypothetical protein [Streptomyces sp. SMS_SU21]